MSKAYALTWTIHYEDYDDSTTTIAIYTNKTYANIRLEAYTDDARMISPTDHWSYALEEHDLIDYVPVEERA